MEMPRKDQRVLLNVWDDFRGAHVPPTVPAERWEGSRDMLGGERQVEVGL